MRSIWIICLAVLACAVGIGAAQIGAQDPAISQRPTPPVGYDLVPSFTEEFYGNGLDTANWINVFAPRSLRDPQVVKRTLWGNGELQVYFDKKYLGLGIDPIRVANGVLTISARPMTGGERAAVQADVSKQRQDFQDAGLKKLSWVSGLISTRDGFSQKYGYFEMRARWSMGKGLWPEFWLLPKDGGWPPEIDILEAHGDKPTTAFQSTHSNHAPKAITRTVSIPGSGDEFHRYGALWLPDRIDYYIDGEKTSSLPTTPDMTQPMYILANLAVGGYWPGYPEPDIKLPATMDIDYIRVWRFRGNPPAPAPVAN